MYRNRTEAGKLLARALKLFEFKDVVVLALPRGGVPVACEVAKELNAPLDVFMVRKLSAPWQSEYGIGAVTETGETIINEEACSRLGVNEKTLRGVIHDQEAELSRRKKLYRADRSLIDVKDKVVILIDDGLATGVTAMASIQSLIKLKPKQIIFAVPVAPKNNSERFAGLCKFIALREEEPFYAVGNFYEDFSQVNDYEVLHYLNQSRKIASAK